MPVEDDDDRLAVLQDFGIEVEIAGHTIIAIFDNQFEDALGNQVEVPVLTVRTSDVYDVSRNDALTISNVAYTVAEKHPDGQGITNIILQKT